MKYLVVGTGGVGGCIAGFLANAGKQVACIARGAHLTALKEKGLKLQSDLKGEHILPIQAFSIEEYHDQPDVIFICVKGYSLEAMDEFIQRISHKEAIIIPILNGFGVGDRLQKKAPSATVLDGCIYIVASLIRPGEVSQSGKIFRIVYGKRPETNCSDQKLHTIGEELAECGIKVDLSEDIRRDTFVKWAFISATAVTGAYYDVPMGEVQKPGQIRDTFIRLSQEMDALAHQMNIPMNESLVDYNLKVLDKMLPESTSSMQKDLKRGGESEIQELLYQVVSMAQENNIDLPNYRFMAEKFKTNN